MGASVAAITCDYHCRSANMRKTRTIIRAIWALVFVGNAIGCAPSKDEKLSQITLLRKNSAIHVEARKDAIVLDITKNGVSKSRNYLYTTDDYGTLAESSWIEPNCGPSKTCVFRNGVLDTIIEAQPNAQSVKIDRVSDGSLRDCYYLGGDTQWYGGPQHRYQHWPIQHMYYEEEPYLPTHQTNMGVAERYWLNSDGFWIWVNETTPLFLDQNNILDQYLCLVARKDKAPYRNRDKTRLQYIIGYAGNPKAAHEIVVSTILDKPSGFPDVRMIQHPVWSTWARYKANVSEKVVEEFANEILAHRFNNSQLEIDDNWETCYGSAVFDPVKFPNVSRLAASLKSKGFRVTLWIHPFVNEGCEPGYSQALKSGYFVKNVNGEVRMSWWQGAQAATVDFTNPQAVKWWLGRLQTILRSGIDGFKFDAGEVSWLPQVASLNASLELQPGAFTTNYVSTLAANFGNLTECRVGWKTQKLPLFVRMIDKDTRWTWNNGLPTLITTLLQMNLNGYVNVLPDMIGGNGYLNNSLNGTFLPSPELFIRWLQANVFMPALQYSFVPWDFDEATVNISRMFTDLHARVTPLIVKAMQAAVATGAPVNPPVWWIAPRDPIAHRINDAFLLGEEILVAPVTREGAVSRDIYLPAGTWKDPNYNRTYNGSTWMYNYLAPINVLPYFIRQINGTYSL